MKLSRLNEDAMNSVNRSISRKQSLKEGILTSEEDNPEFLYKMLDRLRSDCDYYLGNGNRNEKFLWAKTVDAQIEEMRDIYNKLEKKPEWLTDKDIDDYERKMKADKIQEDTTVMDPPVKRTRAKKQKVFDGLWDEVYARMVRMAPENIDEPYKGIYDYDADNFLGVGPAPSYYDRPGYDTLRVEVDPSTDKRTLDYAEQVAKEYGLTYLLKDEKNPITGKVNKTMIIIYVPEDAPAANHEPPARYKTGKREPVLKMAESKEDDILVAATRQTGKKLSDAANQLMSLVGEIINDSNLRPLLTKEDREKIFEVHDILNNLARSANSGAVTITDSLKEAADSDAIVSDLSNSGIASMIIGAINDEWEAIDYYNSMIVTAESEGKSDVANIANDILKEENIHVGQLQKLLSMINPETEAIADGEDEAEEQLGEDNSEEDNLEECKSTLSEDEDKQISQHLDEFFTCDNVEFHIRESKGRIYITSIRPYDLSEYSFAVSKDDGEQFSIYRDGKFIEQFSPSTFEEDEESGIKNFNWNEVARELLRIDKDIEPRIDHT